MSFPVSVEPEEAIPRIFFETMVEIAPEIAKTQGASMGRKISRLTPDRQSVFWLAFLVALNKCFGEALYSTHSFWKVLLINGINPLDICYAMTNIPDSELTENHSMVRSDYFWMEMLNPEDPLYNILPDDRTIEFYSDRMGRWDEIISQALSLKTNYVKPNFEIGIPETKPYSRLMRVAISSLSLEEFIQSSKHFTPSITSWVEYLKSTSTDLMAQKAANLLRNVIDAGGYHVKTSINPDSSPEKVSMTLDLIAGLGITQGEWEADHFKFNEWLQMYFPYGIGALPIATSAMRLNNDSLTVDTLGAMIYFYQNATPLFEMIPRNRQLEFFGKAIRCQIGLGIGQSIDSLHKLASIIDWYWDFFLASGIGDIKGHSCLDGLCVSFEAAEYFHANGFLRKDPHLNFEDEGDCEPFSVRLTEAKTGSITHIEACEIERLVDLLISIGHSRIIITWLNNWLSNKEKPNFLEDGAFSMFLIVLFSRNVDGLSSISLSGPTLGMLERAGVDLSKLRKSGIFDEQLHEFLMRDLGL